MARSASASPRKRADDVATEALKHILERQRDEQLVLDHKDAEVFQIGHAGSAKRSIMSLRTHDMQIPFHAPEHKLNNFLRALDFITLDPASI